MTHKQDRRKEYKVEYQKVALLINDFDPCGLIAAGAPLDEYDGLTHKIMGYMQDKKSRDEIKEMIIYELEHYFGCLEIAAMKEPFKTRFNKDIDELLNKLLK